MFSYDIGKSSIDDAGVFINKFDSIQFYEPNNIRVNIYPHDFTNQIKR